MARRLPRFTVPVHLLVLLFSLAAMIHGQGLDLLSWDLDLNAGHLTLRTSALSGVATANTNCSKLTLSSSALQLPTSTFVRLTGCVGIESVVLSTISFALTIADLNSLKSTTNLATSVGDTFLRIEAGNGIRETGSGLELRSYNNGVPVTNFISDLTPPVLVAFTLNLNNNSMTLTFDEPVTSTGNFSTLELLPLNENRYRISYRLSDGIFDPNLGNISTQVTFTLNASDVSVLKGWTRGIYYYYYSIATSEHNTFLSINGTFVLDTNGNGNVLIPWTNPLQVATFIEDTTPPRIISFTLDMDSGVLMIYFDDALTYFSQLNVSAITIQSRACRIPMESHTLDPRSSRGFSSYSRQEFPAIVFLGIEDLNRVKQIRNLATSSENTYITVTSSLTSDANCNSLVSVTDCQALAVQEFSEDISRPRLSSWSLDMDVGQITLSFDETVDVLSFNSSSIRIARASCDTGYRLSSLAVVLPVSMNANASITLQLSNEDLNNIKQDGGLAINNLTAWLKMDETTIADMNFNQVFSNSTNLCSAMSVGTYTPDETRPTLVAFDLDMDTGLVSLTFDEIVQVNTLKPTTVMLVNASAPPQVKHHLTDATTVSSTNSTVLNFEIMSSDLDKIKAVGDLATSRRNTFITTLPWTVYDTNWNRINEVTGDSALRVNRYTSDTTPPQIVLSSLEINQCIGRFQMTFTETVDVASISLSGITLQNSATSPTRTFSLTGGTFSLVNSPVLEVIFTRADLNAFLNLTDIGTSISDTFIAISPLFIHDMSGNQVMGTIQAVTSFSSTDCSGPSDIRSLNVLEWTFNTEESEISIEVSGIGIQFLESAIDCTAFTLVNSNNNPIESLQLTGCDNLHQSGPLEITFSLTQTDRRSLEQNYFSLARSHHTNFLIVNSGNGIRELGSGRELRVNAPGVQASPLDTRTSIIAFSIDMNSGTLSLTFDNQISESTVDITAITLQDSVNRTVWFTLSRDSAYTSSFTTLSVRISRNDIDQLKLIRNLATSAENSYLTVTANLVQDRNGRDIKPIVDGQALQASSFTSDTISPSIAGWSLDLDSGELSLTFSETVDALTLNAPGIGVQRSPFVAPNFLTGVVNTSSDAGSSFAFRFTDQDLDNIKNDYRLGSSIANTFLSITSGAILDMNSNPILPTGGLRVSVLWVDRTRPFVQSYTLDMDIGVLTITYSEIVDASSFSVGSVRIVNRGSQEIVEPNFVYQYFYLSSRSGSTASTVNSRTITVTFSHSDLNRLKSLSNIANSRNRTYLSYSRVFDLNRNRVEYNRILRPIEFIPDTTSPELISFSLDMCVQQLVLTFSETVNASTLNLTQISIRSPVTMTFIPLTGGTVYNGTNHIITLQLSSADFTMLNSPQRNHDNTLLTLTSSTILDSFENSVIEIPLTSPLQAERYIPSLSCPPGMELTLWTLNLQSSSLTIVVSGASLDLNNSICERFAIVSDNSSIPAASLTLSDCSLRINNNVGDRVLIYLSNADRSSIQLNPNLGNDLSDTYLSVQIGNGIRSSSTGEELRAYINENVRQVTNITEHITGTYMRMFTLDMNLGQLVLYFYDPLDPDVTTVVDVTQLSLGGVSHYADPCSFYSLTTSRVVSVNNSNPFYVTIQLSVEDLNLIKSRTDVATNISNTYLIFEPHTFRDFNLNGNYHGDVYLASEFIPDSTPPTIVSFTINLANSVLLLTFDEPVFINSVNLSQIILHSSQSGSGPSYQLTGGEPVTSDISYVAAFQFSITDIRSLAQNNALATSTNDTYLSASAGTANDTNNNPSVGIPISSNLQVSEVIPVSTPRIVQFSLDMDEGEIVLEFSNFILASSVDVGAITLQNHSSQMESEWLTLSRESSTVSDEDSTRLIVSLGNEDLNRLIMIPNLATSLSSTFLAISTNFGTDFYGNAVVSISETNALQASLFIPDTTSPSIESWTLDMNVGQITMTFSEFVEASSFDPTRILLQNTKAELFASDSTRYILTGGSVGSVELRYVTSLVLQLTVSDTNVIKYLAGYENMGSDRSNTFLTSVFGLVNDLNRNPSLAIFANCSLQVETFIRDTTGPVLTSFGLDMNAGVLFLSFDEPVNASTTISTDLTLTNHQFLPTATYTLTGGSSLSQPINVLLTMPLSVSDLNNIKRSRNLAVNFSTSFLSVNPGFVRDVSGNRLRSASVVQASQYVPDATPPNLVEYSLDVCSEELILTFSETIDSNSVNPTGITMIQDTLDTVNRMYTLTGGIVSTLEDDTVVVIQLSTNDASIVFDNTTIVNTSSISITSNTVSDVFGIQLVAIAIAEPLRVSLLNTSCISRPIFVGATRVDGSCVAVPLNTTWLEPIIAESGALGVRITAINVSASSMSEVQTSPLTPTSNPRRWYINVTWTPDTVDDMESNLTLCYIATDCEGSLSRESCISLIAGVEAPQIVTNSLSPRGDILFNHAMWSVQFSKEFHRPSQARFIRIFAANGTELITINTSRSDVSYPQGRLGRELTFRTSYLFTEKEYYYVLLDAGVAQGQDLCGLDSPALNDPTVWTVRIADVTPPTLTFTRNPSYTNANVTISWTFDEATTSQCTLVTPSTPFRVPCPNDTFVRTGLTDGVYTLFVAGTDLEGNTAQTVRHSWTVDVTPPRVRITSAPPSVTNQLQARFNFGCIGEWRCTYVCSVHLLNGSPQYSACGGSYTAGNLANDGQYEFSVIATDGVGNVGSPFNHRWRIDITPPTIPSLGDTTLPCGQDYSPASVGTPIVDVGVRLRFTDVTSAMCTVVRTWTATDEAGNTATETQTITFSSPLPPQVTALPDINIPCGSVEDAIRNVATEDLEVTHPCDRPVVVTFMDTATVTMCGFTFTRTWMVNDDCDGSVTFNQNIRVLQQQFPESPIDGQMNARLDEPLAWPHYPGALSYRVFIWEFGTNRTDQPVATLTSRRYTPSTNYNPGTRYLWQIEYVTGVNTSVPSPVWGFETRYFPDLTVTNVMIPEYVFSGQSFDVSWTVINRGNISTPTSAWTDAVYTSTTPNFGSSSRRAVIAQNRFADPQDGYVSSTTINLDVTFTGNLYVFVRTDIYNQVLDFDRDNNIRGAIAPLEVRLTPPPNLVVETIFTPRSPRSGERIAIRWRVRNIGLGVTATNQWTDRVYLSTDNRLDSSDRHLGNYGHTGVLGEGSSYENGANVTLPQKIYGNYYILVTTDVYDNVFEHAATNDNTNSSSPMLVILSPPPDLVVASVAAQATYATGSVMRVSYTVRNLGPGEPFERYWRDAVALTPLFTGASRRIISVLDYRGNLALDANYTRHISYTVSPSFPTGRYNMSVETDFGNNVFEFNNEGNNVAYRVVSILQALPDLLVASAGATVQTTSRGNTILLNYTVNNMGIAQTVGAPWRDRVIISSVTVGGSAYYNSPYQRSELGVNSGYTRSLSLGVRRTIYGNVNLNLYIDSTGRIVETTETNNRHTIGPLYLPPVFPDLAITLQVHPTTLVAVAGSMITIRWTVMNIGNGLIERACFTDQVYLDITPQLSSIARRLSAPRLCPTLHPNSRYNESATISLPETFSGPYFIIVRTDDRGEIDENGREANNIASMPITINAQPSPDLIVTSVTYNYIQTEAKDRILNVNWRVNNNGNSMTNEQSWTDQVFVSGEQTFTRDAALRIWQRGITNLRLDYLGTYTASASILIPTRIFGDFFIYVETDGTNQVTEINGEDNNVLRATNRLYIDEPAAARLTINLNTTLVPSSLNGGENMTIIYDVTNTGDAALAATSWIDRVYLIADRNLRRNDIVDSGIFLAQALNNRPQGLPDGESYNFSMNTRAPYGILSQLFHVAVVVDINSDLGDPDQLSTLYVDQNFILIQQGPLPDLVLVPTTTNMTSLFGGQPTMVTYRVENRGNNTASGLWYEALFLSQDIVLDPFDTRLRTVSRLRDLPIGESYNRSVEVFIPFDMPSGPYYFFYRVDARDHIEESEENNNFEYQLTSIVETVSTDITAVSATAFPTTLNYGDSVTFQWVLRNNGSLEARGYKCDSIYLSEDDSWDITDTQIGLPQCGVVRLAPYAGNSQNDRGYRQTEATPFIAQNSYTGIVRTRTNIRDPNLRNNIVTTTTPIQVTAPELFLDTLTTIELSSGEELVYRIENVPGEETLIATLTSSGGDAAFHDLLLRYDNPPTGYAHDAFSQMGLSSDQRAVVRNTRSGTYYLRIDSSGFTTQQYRVRVLVRVARFEILDVAPRSAAPLGNVTIQLSGTVLGYYLEASLINAANPETVCTASQLYWFNSEQAYATFDITNYPTGMYTIQLTNTMTGEVTQLASRFEIAQGIPGQVAARLLLPGTLAIRGRSQGTITALVANRGNTDIPIPLMKLSTGGRSNIQLVDGAFTTSFSSEINFLPNPASGPAGILPPGATAEVRFNLILAGGGGRSVRDPVRLSYIQTPDDQHDYVNMKDDLRPSTIEPSAWDVIWQNFMSSVGTTWGSLNQRISQIATELSMFGRKMHTTESVVDYLLQMSDGLLTGDIVVDIQDIEEEGIDTAVPLKLMREYSSRIKNRRTAGPMGMGWQLPWWEMKIRNVTGSEVQLQTSRSEMIAFSAVSNGLYRSPMGYYITVDNGGVNYLDTEHQLQFVFHRQSGKLMEISFAGDNTSMQIDYRGEEWPSLFTHSNGKKLNVTYTTSGRISYVDILDQDDNIEQSSLYSYDESETYLTGITIGNSSTSYTYNEQGDLTSINYASGKRKTLEYDDKHMLCGLKYFNNVGEYTAGTTFMQDGNGNVELTIWPRNQTQMMLFDMEGIPVAVRPEGGLPSYSVGSPNIEGERNILGDKVLIESYRDEETKTNTQIDANGNRLTYQYGEYGLERFVDNDGNEYRTVFDNEGRITEYQNPDGSRSRLNYDDVGHVSSMVNPDGSEVTYSYDLNDQVIQKILPGDQISYEYDEKKRLRRATNAQGSVMIFYNSNDSPHQIVYSNGRTLTYGYNNENQRSFITDNNGYNVTYTYDGGDRLSEIRQASTGELVTGFDYNEKGRLSRKTLGNGAYTIYGYDEVSGLLTELRNYLPNGTLSSSFLYEYDRERKVVGISTHTGNNTYGYDASGQLVKWTDENGDVTEYRYDSRGNRLVVRRNGREEGYSVNNMNQYMSYNGTEVLLYDMNGNLREKSSSERRERFVFDAEGRLTQTETPDIRCSYLYDALGNLHRKNCLNSSFEYLVDPLGRFGADIIAEIAGNETTYFIHSFEEGLAAAMSLNNMSMTYYEQNAEGSIVGVMDDEGNILNTYQYNPFGEILQQTEEVRNIFKYAGRFGVICDEELQHIYMMRARHYDAKHGRFISPDPLGLSGSSPNLYAYVMNNPLTGKDPSGKIAFLLPYIGWGILGVGAYLAERIKTAQPITLGGIVGSFVTGAILGPFGGASIPITLTRVLKLLPISFLGKSLGSIAEGAVDQGSDFFAGAMPVLDAVGDAANSALTDAISTYFGKFIGHLERFVPKKFSGVYNTQSDDMKGCLKMLTKFFAESGISYALDELFRVVTEYGPSIFDGFVEWIGSSDPNDIIGPAGYGAARFIPPELTLEYTIRFENEENATAPAQRVFIVHVLDNDLDIRTFRLGSFGFSDFVRNVTANRAVLQDIVNLTETHGVFVRVRAGIDVVNNQATWEMQALDPETGEPPADPRIGFLPPNNDTDGQGFVKFSVRARRDVQSLARIDATASIFFDLNEPIETPPIFNTIDGSAPSTVLSVNQELIENGTLALELNKTDVGSGVDGVDIYQLVSEGTNLPMARPLIIGAKEDTVVLPLSPGAEYTVFASTVDNVGNRRSISEDMQNIMRIDFPIVEVPCPDDCSGRGNCTQFGTCLCDEGFFGSNCSEAGTQVQPPILVLSSLGGIEDTPVGIQLSAMSAETGSSDDLLVHVTSYPQGASFSQGTLNADVWTFAPAEFGEIQMSLPLHYSGIANLQAHATSNIDATVLREGSLQVDIQGIADAPFILTDVDTTTLCNNLERITIPLFFHLIDTDGSETLGDIIVSGLPEFANVTNAQLGPNGEYTLSPQNLSAIVIELGGTQDLSFVVSITAQAIELANGDIEIANASVPVECIRSINECEEGSHKCEQICTDTEEAYTCSCTDQYTLDENGFNCTEKVVVVMTTEIPSVEQDSIPIESVAGGVVGALILLIPVVLSVLCCVAYCKRHRRKDDIYTTHMNEAALTKENPTFVENYQLENYDGSKSQVDESSELETEELGGSKETEQLGGSNSEEDKKLSMEPTEDEESGDHELPDPDKKPLDSSEDNKTVVELAEDSRSGTQDESRDTEQVDGYEADRTSEEKLAASDDDEKQDEDSEPLVPTMI